MLTHGQRDPITKLYWNAVTNKYLKKPVRETTKGKTKGKTHQLKLYAIQQSGQKWQSYGWLPINMTIQDIEQKALVLWTDASKFCIDKALALSSLMIVSRAKTEKKNTYAYKLGKINVYSKNMQEWVGKNYGVYLQFFEDAGFIKEYKKGKKGYMANHYPKQYMFTPRLLKKQGDERKYHRVPYSTPKMLVKIFEDKQQKKSQILKLNTRQVMVSNVYEMAESIDLNAFETYCRANPKKFKSIDSMEDTIVLIGKVQQGKVYMNPRCDYGFRFHSPFTNITKLVRKFITINGSYASEVDVKNSQFFFLACLTLYPEVCIDLLKKSMKKYELVAITVFLKQCYDSYSDFKRFIDAALVGTVYQVMISDFSLLGKKTTKNKVKDLCFKALFSDDEQCLKSKEKLKPLYPNLVKTCEILNNGKNRPYPLPKLLQRLESSILIDIVAVEAINQGCDTFTTVHDSFLCSSSDVPLFKYVVGQEFNKIGLPVPMLK